jgi:hypothetical protein
MMFVVVEGMAQLLSQSRNEPTPDSARQFTSREQRSGFWEHCLAIEKE